MFLLDVLYLRQFALGAVPEGRSRDFRLLAYIDSFYRIAIDERFLGQHRESPTLTVILLFAIVFILPCCSREQCALKSRSA